MRLYCEHCHESFQVAPEEKGHEVVCPACGTARPCPEVAVAPGVVLGDFLIEKPITSGGMGQIFIARQLSLDREVALKVLLEKFSQSAECAEALLHEARAAAKLNHPNIVQAYAVGREDGVFFFAMELIRGETGKELLKRKKRLDGLEASKIILDVARALDAAWSEQKIVHQDIKPENIMLDASGFAKLADLGLARRAGSDTESDSDEVMGTPQYISPEQLTGVPTDVRSDIYSLGATFYHFVTGRFPYVAPTTEEITRMHVEGKLQPPIEVYDHLSVELNRIILKMMARKIEERYQTPKELIADLENYVRGETADVTRQVKVRRFWTRRTKKWIFRSALGVLLLAVIALILGSIFPSYVPGFARGIFLKCHQKGMDAFAACKAFFTPAEKPPEVPPPAPEVVGREALLAAGNALLQRVRNGESSTALLNETDAFFRQYASPQTKAEKELMLQLSVATGHADEVLRQAPARQKARTQYQSELDRAAAERKAAKAREQEKARRRQAEEKAAKQRALAKQREAEREAQEKARAEAAILAEKIARINAVLQPFARQLWSDFLTCAAKNDTVTWERQWSQSVALPSGVDPRDVKARLEFFERYRKSLKTMFPDYARFCAQLRALPKLGISVSIPTCGICYILSLSPQRVGHFRTIRGVEFDFSLDEKHPTETMRFLHAFGRKLGWQSGESPAAFYYALYTGHLTPGAIKFAPDDFWRVFGEPLKLEIPAP